MCKRCSVIVYIYILLLSGLSYGFTEQNYLAPEQWACDTKSVDQKDIRDRNNKPYYKYVESFNITSLPLLPIIFAQSEYLPNGKCKEDARHFINELQNGTLWAMQMFDSSSKYPDGVLYGNTRHLGNFDECYNLQVHVRGSSSKKDIGTNEIIGKYCLINLKYEKKDKSKMSHKLSLLDFDLNESFWEAVEERGNFLRVPRYFLQLAICVPSSCSAKEVETALNMSLEEINVNNNIDIQVDVQPAFCQTVEEEPKFTFAAKVYCIVLMGLLTLIIISSYYEVKLNTAKWNISTFQNVILCFSLQRNFKDIFKLNYSGIVNLHYIRFILTSLIMFGHRSFQYYLNSTINIIHLEKFLVLPISAFCVNAVILSDLCFATAAILVTYYLLEHLDRRKSFNFVNNTIARYLRLTPAYVTVIFFYAWIFPLFGSGPFWRPYVEQEAIHCANNWWTNVLYVNNYVKPEENCMFQSWYISTDFQLFILSQFVIYAFWRMPRKIGYLFLGALAIISCTIPFFATYLYSVFPTIQPKLFMHQFKDLVLHASDFNKTQMRSTGYFVGIITGAIIHDSKRIPWQMPKVWSHILVFPLPITLITVLTLWSHKFLMPYDDSSVLETALFAAGHRLVITSCVCTMIIVLSTSQLKFYQNVLTIRWAQPLARLSYGVFLVGDIFHVYHYGRTRSARMFSSFDMIVWETIPDMVCCFTVSLLLALCVEEPFRKLTIQFLAKNNKNVNEKYTQ